MKNLKLIIEYKGTSFEGWQKQKRTQRTVQGELERCLKQICKGQEVKSLGSGRTDAGVHALAQTIKVQIPLEIEDHALLKGLNSIIDKEIKVLSVEEVDDNFHPIGEVKAKEYRYYFTNEGHPSPLLNDLIANYRFSLNQKLMEDACKLFVGKHDFSSLHSKGSDPSSTIREIFECELIKMPDSFLSPIFKGNVYCFRVKGEGFLRQMVRYMVGATWEVGGKKRELSWLENILQEEAKDDKKPVVAPAKGLYMHQVEY